MVEPIESDPVETGTPVIPGTDTPADAETGQPLEQEDPDLDTGPELDPADGAEDDGDDNQG